MRFFFIFLIICLNRVSLAASYAPLSPIDHMEESPGDESRIKLAYSNAHYDNVGMVYRSYDLTKKCYDLLNKNDESSFYSNASAVYIGNGLCLTAAHAIHRNTELAVCFEINGEKTRLYHVSEFIIHPNYIEKKTFDIAVLVLDKYADRLPGLPPFYEFSEKTVYFKDRQHLLTYIGYGMKLFCNDWFLFSNVSVWPSTYFTVSRRQCQVVFIPGFIVGSRAV